MGNRCCGSKAPELEIMTTANRQPVEDKIAFYEELIQKCSEEDLPSKVKYKGQYNKSKMRHGIGKLIFPDGSFYIGNFENNVCKGHGILIINREESMEGTWKNDQINGFSHLSFKNYSYEGECLNGMPHGKGVMIYLDNGGMYDGEFIFGQKQGRGKFVIADLTYEGYFNNDMMEGFGKCIWIDGRSYTGTWLHNKMEGKGVFTWPDGTNYEGEYEGNLKHGFGVLKDKEGKVLYKGYWMRGEKYEKNVE